MSGINAIGRKQAAMRPAAGENVIFLSYAAIADTSISAAMPESNFSVITALRGYFIGVKPFYLLIIFLRAS
ncbi:hypothetical protein [Pseudomonas taeanensis]|uniref:hypothetical protein n=1 Tax=Pseudomonas taeanensis TaxID=574962 RepID=UPI00128F8BE9|nr:hypothetical protein [Pseudomonas taeanensis]